MNYFLKTNKNLIVYTIIFLVVIPFVGINFFVSVLGNILILLLLIPILLLLLVFVGFNYYKSKINTCHNCGAISLGLNEFCMSCGADLKEINKNDIQNKQPSESTIEVTAEEIQ